ncbi:MAG: O-antigen ligase family protein [Bacteroidetes bacterium]|nr:O-antigen ligase family protein [Bacteroidota bacterium]
MIKTKFAYKSYSYLLIALAFLLPIHDRLVAPVIVLIGLVWILELNFAEKWERIRSSKTNSYLMGFGLLFLVYVAGSFYSEHITGKTGALFTLQVKLSLFVFPLLFSTIDVHLLKDNIAHRITKSFVWGSLITSFIILNNAVYQYFIDQSTNVFFYTRLSMKHHPSYLSLLFSFAIIILVNWLITNKQKTDLKRIAAMVLVIYFQVFIILLSSKAGIVGLVLVYISLIIMTILKSHNNIKYVSILITALLAAFVIILIMTPPAYQRFFAAERALESKLQPDSTSIDGSVARMLIWKSSLEIILEHPIIGVGTGDVNYTLLNKYRKHHIVMAEEREYNAHNQYLQTYLGVGLPGFLILIGCLGIALIVAFKHNNLLYLSFILLFAFHILVESMLERQAGVVFYAFFNALLFYFTLEKKPATSES